MSRTPTQAEALDAMDLLPGHDWAGGHVEEGGDDHLVVIPGDAEPRAVLRMARRLEVATALPRRMALLNALAPHLTWQVPTPLTEVTQLSRTGTRAVGQRYVTGVQHPPHCCDVASLSRLLQELVSVPESAWRTHVEPAYAVHPRWDASRRDITRTLLPARNQPQAEAIWEALEAIEGEAVGLVHGDLAGDNMRWDGERVVGILDWDHAARWDPAINLAHLALWHGPDALAAAPDSRFAARAGVWMGHLALIRVHDAAQRQAAGVALRRVDRLLRKTLPRLDVAAAAARLVLNAEEPGSHL
ncbi:MAG: phosphotransferase family protein [Galactobacter sp.]